MNPSVVKLLAASLFSDGQFRCRTSHEPNHMIIRENNGFFSFAFDSAHVNYGVFSSECVNKRVVWMERGLGDTRQRHEHHSHVSQWLLVWDVLPQNPCLISRGKQTVGSLRGGMFEGPVSCMYLCKWFLWPTLWPNERHDAITIIINFASKSWTCHDKTWSIWVTNIATISGKDMCHVNMKHKATR